ncbi:hypothetical protein MFRU_001g01870 [Monilinia fructicola]|nr:hypothetical protein MFRU_001g01870 [Monilinia fructicola]
MSHLWPHPPYAEDQPYPHLILWTHILTRAPPTSAFLTPLLKTSTHTLQKLHLLPPPKAPLPIPTPTPHVLLLRATGANTLTISGILVLATIARMYGREEIEWKDRSWRLLENRGQRECDAWMYVGMAAGGLMGLRRNWEWRVRVGSLGLGSAVGVLGYLGWRYGVKGGKWEEGTGNEGAL